MSLDIEFMPALSSEFDTGTTGEETGWDMAPPTVGPPGRNPWTAAVARRMTRRLVESVESGRAAEVCALFAEDAVLTLGNNRPIIGRDAINTGVEKLFQTVEDLRPRIVNTWHTSADTIVEATWDLSPLTSNGPLTGAVIWRAGPDGLIHDLRIHLDLTSTTVPRVR